MVNNLSILGFDGDKWVHCKNPQKMDALKSSYSSLFDNQDKYIESLKKSNKVCSRLFSLFITVNVSFKDVLLPITSRRNLDLLGLHSLLGMPLIELITLVFRIVFLIPRAIYQALQMPAYKCSYPLSYTKTIGDNNDLPVLVTVRKKESFYFSHTSMHIDDAKNYFDNAIKKKAEHQELIFSSDNRESSFVKIQPTKILKYGKSGIVKIPYPDQAKAIKLTDFLKMDKETRQRTIEKFELYEIVSDEFFAKLAKADSRLLEILDLEDLIKDRYENHVKIALMSDDEFNKITLGSINNRTFYTTGIKIIKLRCSYATVDDNFSGDWKDMTLTQFYHLSSEKANKLIEDNKFYLVNFMSDKNLKKLNPNCTKEQFLEIMKRICIYQLPEYTKENFAKLSPEFVAAHLDHLNHYQYNIISDEQFKALDISKLTRSQLTYLMGYSAVAIHRASLLDLEKIKIVESKLS